MGRRLRYARSAVLFTAGAVALTTVLGSGSSGCRTATQVTVELRTVPGLTCAALKGVAIVVARTPAEAEEKMRISTLSAEVPRGQCGSDPNLIGTLVITPSDSTGAVVVRARISEAAESTCRPPDYKGCIVARRSFSFVDHTALTMPISLEIDCLDVPCDVVTSCRTGSCVSSAAECSESTSKCQSVAEPEVGPDGRPILPDGAVGDAAPLDASSDSAATDSSSDAADDVVSDAELPDADPGNWGNLCPSMPAMECPASCCFMGSFMCGDPCTPTYFNFQCVGRKACNKSYCCGGADRQQPQSSCDNTGGQMCAQNGSHYICTTSADCPPQLPYCNGVYYTARTGTIKECTMR